MNTYLNLVAYIESDGLYGCEHITETWLKEIYQMFHNIIHIHKKYFVGLTIFHEILSVPHKVPQNIIMDLNNAMSPTSWLDLFCIDKVPKLCEVGNPFNPWLPKPMNWSFRVHFTPYSLWTFHAQVLRSKWALSIGSQNMGAELFWGG